MRARSTAAAATIALVLTLTACGSSSPSASTSSKSTTTPAGAADPNAPEVVEPGDIPDNQVFVAYTPPGASFSVKVPEGWSRSSAGETVTFTDKYNSIQISSSDGTQAPTVASVKASGLGDVTSDPTFALGSVKKVTRSGVPAVVASYEIGSPPNDVTGKSALLAVERYELEKNGTTVVLTLSGAKGADNVDPWKIVSDSVVWT
jgi:hypothetical protein